MYMNETEIRFSPKKDLFGGSWGGVKKKIYIYIASERIPCALSPDESWSAQQTRPDDHQSFQMHVSAWGIVKIMVPFWVP